MPKAKAKHGDKSRAKHGDKSRVEGRVEFAKLGNRLLLTCLEQVTRDLHTNGIFHEPEWTYCCDLRKEILSRMSDDAGKLQEFPLAEPG